MNIVDFSCTTPEIREISENTVRNLFLKKFCLNYEKQ